MAGSHNQEQIAPLAPVRASKIQYIKLGAGGAWEASCFANGRIEWGIDSDPHDLPAAGDWARLREHYISAGFAPSTASGYVTEARAFYEGAPDVLWITFSRGHLWWTFAEAEVHYLGAAGNTAGSRYRTAIGGWKNCDIHGVPLSIDRLSTRLTKLASYPRTICLVKEAGFCLRYINGEEDSDAAAVQAARDQLEQSIGTLIKRLNWDDFELLSDLILSRSGWRRVSSLGGIMKDIDLLVEQPLTGQRMAVQVKSAATRETFLNYRARLIEQGAADSMLLICHSPSFDVASVGDPSATILTGSRLARLAVDCGLTQWILDRAR